MSHVSKTQKKFTYNTRSSRRAPSSTSDKFSVQPLTDNRRRAEDSTAPVGPFDSSPCCSEPNSQFSLVQAPQCQSSSQPSSVREVEMEKKNNKNKNKRRKAHLGRSNANDSGNFINGMDAGGVFAAASSTHKDQHSERRAERREARDHETLAVGVQPVDPIIVSTCDPSRSLSNVASNISSFSISEKQLRATDKWAISWIGKKFCYKNTDPEWQTTQHLHPTNLFTFVDVVLMKKIDDKFILLQYTHRYATRDLHFAVKSTDVSDGIEYFPVASFRSSLTERDRLFREHNDNDNLYQSERVKPVGYYMQGVNDDDMIINLLPGQLGVLLTLQPPAKSYIRDEAVLCCY